MITTRAWFVLLLMRAGRLFGCLLVLFGTGVTTYAQDKISLRPHTSFAADPRGDIHHVSAYTFSATPLSSAGWVKINLPPTLKAGAYCLATSFQGHWQVYVMRDTIVGYAQNGRYLAPSQRTLPEDFRYVPLTLTEADRTLYIYVDDNSRDESSFDFVLTPAQTTLQSIRWRTHLSFISMGTNLLIAVAAFILFIFLYDGVYLRFGAYIVASFIMTNTLFLGYLLGDALPFWFLGPEVLQCYFVLSPVSLIWFALGYFQISMQSVVWSRIFYILLASSLICIITIPLDYDFNSDLILLYNVITLLVVGSYAWVAHIRYQFQPARYFLYAYLVPVLAAILIVINYVGLIHFPGVSLVANISFLIQSLILSIGVVMRFQKVSHELLRVTLSKWQKEHEAQFLKLENTDLISQKDIIEKQKMQIEEQTRRLQESNATKDKLLSVLSHDLRGPIGNLRSVMNMLSDKLLTHDEFQQLSGRLRHDVEGAYGMLEEVLHWVKSQKEGIEPNPTLFNIRTVVDEVVTQSCAGVEEKKLHVQVLGREEVQVYADQDHVHIILRNLLSNAIKFSMPGSSISIGLLMNEGETEIKVADSGTGISPLEVERIINGHKVNSTRGTRGEKGTGLGLMLTREFIQHNGGRFSVESTPGKGTVVTFTLPWSRA